MNSPADSSQPTARPAVLFPDDPRPLVAVAVDPSLIGRVNAAMSLIFHNALQAFLRHTDLGPFHLYPLYSERGLVEFMLCDDAEKSLFALRAFMHDELNLLALCELAFYDRDANLWRTVHPENPAEPFERHVLIETFNAAYEEAEKRKEFLTLLAEGQRWNQLFEHLGIDPSTFPDDPPEQ